MDVNIEFIREIAFEENENCKQILIVDDTYFNILALETILNQNFEKIKTQSCFNGNQALSILEERL